MEEISVDKNVDSCVGSYVGSMVGSNVGSAVGVGVVGEYVTEFVVVIPTQPYGQLHELPEWHNKSPLIHPFGLPQSISHKP